MSESKEDRAVTGGKGGEKVSCRVAVKGTRPPPGHKRVTFAVISDTHGRHHEMAKAGSIPEADVLLHCGDIGIEKPDVDPYVKDFDRFLAALPHKHKVVICGNHEVGLGTGRFSAADIQAMMPHCTYLQDSSTTIDGIKIYGSPWTNIRGHGFCAGGSDRMMEMWNKIPDDTDVLMTHMPPFNVFDTAWVRGPGVQGVCPVCDKEHPRYNHWGCRGLRRTVLERVKPIVHAFGHVHDANGKGSIDKTVFINAAMDLKPKAHTFAVDVPVAM